MKNLPLFAAGCLLALAAGCRQESTTTYNIPKQATPQSPAAAAAQNPHGGNPAPQHTVKWKTPDGWKETVGSGMRLVTFAVDGPGDTKAEIAVIPLPGVTGKEPDLVNIFRERYQLVPLSPEDLEKARQKAAIGSGEGVLFDMTGESNATNQNRMLTAVLNQGGSSFYFNMAGAAPLVVAEKPRFLEFLKSVTIEENPEATAAAAAAGPDALPPGHPPVSGAPGKGAMMAGAPKPQASPAAAGEIADVDAAATPKWEVPTGWKQVPPTQMLIARFSLGDDAKKAETTVSSFPGDVGGLIPNVNRWRNQIGLGPMPEAEAQKAIVALETPGGQASLVDMTGTRGGQPVRLIGAIVPRGGQTWFFKMVGDASVVDKEKAAFELFLKSVKYPNG